MAQNEKMMTSQTQQILGTAGSAADAGTISGLREQIRSNAGLLFPHATTAMAQAAYDVVVLTADGSGGATSLLGNTYEALLTVIVPGGFSMRAATMLAQGQPSPSVVAALHSLLHVLAAALEKYQGNVLKQSNERPVEIAGGMIDEAMVLGRAKKPWFGGGKE